ncbi:helix-turn-helix domain-containing protein [[Bacillus] enclensis]
MNRELSKSRLAKELGVSRPTLNKLIKEHQQLS